MRLLTLTTVLALCLAPLANAQVKAFGGPGTRHSSTLFLFTEKFEVKAGLSLQHGQPTWHADYDDPKTFEKFLDQYKGQQLRLGKDWWTTFDNSVPVQIGGSTIPAGSWFLGLSYGKDGSFELLVIDAAAAMKAATMPFVPERYTAAHKAPLKFEKDAAKESVELMTIDIVADEKDPTKATFQVAWGKHRLVADMKLMVDAK